VSPGFLNGLYIIPILAVLILVHEFGHYFAARSVGVKVEEFGIGIPPRIKGWMWDGVLWSINWIPFGGFVKVLGEDGKSTDPRSMNAKAPLQRAFFLVAGSGMNFVLAVVLSVFVVGIQGVSTSNVYIGTVVPDSPAAHAGWREGDRIIEVGGAPVLSADDVGGAARDFAGRPMSVVLLRDGKEIDTTVTPRTNPPANQGPTGVGVSEAIVSDLKVTDVALGSPAANAGIEAGDTIVSIGGIDMTDQFAFAGAIDNASGTALPIVVSRGGAERTLSLTLPKIEPSANLQEATGLGIRLYPIFAHVPPLQVIPRGLSDALSQTGQMLAGLRDLVTGHAPLAGIAGPIGMGQITSEVLQSSPLPKWVTLSQIATLLSLNLAILNLLPLPALDGGRLLFVIIEMLRGGKRVAPEREGIVHLAGLVILLGLMFIIAFLDVGRLLGGRSFLP
jgi:regulator of sigma E protease